MKSKAQIGTCLHLYYYEYNFVFFSIFLIRSIVENNVCTYARNCAESYTFGQMGTYSVHTRSQWQQSTKWLLLVRIVFACARQICVWRMYRLQHLFTLSRCPHCPPSPESRFDWTDCPIGSELQFDYFKTTSTYELLYYEAIGPRLTQLYVTMYTIVFLILDE